VVPAANVFQAIAQTACQLYSAEIIMGHSTVIPSSQLALRLGEVWEKLSHKPKHQVSLRIFESSGKFQDFLLGAHAPQFSEEDIDHIHRLWLDVKLEMGREILHHKDIVTISLLNLENQLKGTDREKLLEEIRKYTATRAEVERRN
jgi:hypothetical protein